MYAVGLRQSTPFHLTRSRRYSNSVKKKVASSSSLESRYTKLSGKNFEGYFNWYNEDLSDLVSKQFINTCKSKFIDTNEVNTNQYLEVGTGRGFVASTLAPNFKHSTIIEPNPLFKDATSNRLESSGVYNTNYIDILIDDFESNKYSMTEKCNLVIMQHVLWTVKLNKWNNVLNELYKLLSNNSALIITQLASKGTLADMNRYFVPEMQFSDYVENYFRNTVSKSIVYNWEDTVTIVVPESIAIIILVDMLKIDFAIYDENIAENKNDEITNLIKEYLKRDGCYSAEINSEIGEYMITINITNSHVVIQNK